MKNLLCAAGVCFILACPALNAQAESPSAADARGRWYVGINPLALGYFLPADVSPAFVAFGFSTGAEAGVALYAGREFSPALALEVRLSTGPSNQAFWDTQAQVGCLWYPCRTFFGWDAGPAVGAFFRNTALANRLTGVWIFSHVPELVVGWRFRAAPVAFDLRAGWNVCALSWSTMPRTRPGIDWIPPPYCFTFSLGVAIEL